MPVEELPEGTTVGARPFDVQLKDLDGQLHRLKDLKGHSVVHLVFWASWCVPCIQEIPAIRETYAKYHDRGLEVLAVVLNIDQTPDDARAVARDYKINYPVLWDERGLARERYRVAAIPQNFLIDREGIIRYAGSALPADYEALVQNLLQRGGEAKTSR